VAEALAAQHLCNISAYRKLININGVAKPWLMSVMSRRILTREQCGGEEITVLLLWSTTALAKTML
jgi:hypothetical protein